MTRARRSVIIAGGGTGSPSPSGTWPSREFTCGDSAEILAPQGEIAADLSVAEVTAWPYRFAAGLTLAMALGCTDSPGRTPSSTLSADSAVLASMIASATDLPKRTATLGPGDSVPDWVAAYFGPRLDTGQVMSSASVRWDSVGGTFVVRVWHERVDQRWPFGTAIALMGRDSALRWLGDFGGDYAPYSLDWIDVNGDGRRDLYSAAGEEDIFNTWVFVDKDGRSDLVLVLKDYLSYSGVVDFDGDRRPEFVTPVFNIRTGMGDDATCPDSARPNPPALFGELGHKALGLYPGVNFDYAMGSEMAAGSAIMLDWPVRIWSIQDTRAVDVTARYDSQIRARRDYAVASKSGAQEKCRRQLDSIVAYFDSVLAAR